VGLLCVRRAILLGAALLPARPLAEVEEEPSVALLVAAHDEAPTLGRLLATIERLDWPRDRLHVVLADDGSADGTWERMQSWAEANEGARALRLDGRVGKSQALNAALAAAPAAEIVVTVDADLRLAPDYLRRLVPAFSDPDVAAASAFVTTANPDATLVARYAALETWVHQLVTAAGKNRLALNPPTFAGSAERRRAGIQVVETAARPYLGQGRQPARAEHALEHLHARRVELEDRQHNAARAPGSSAAARAPAHALGGPATLLVHALPASVDFRGGLGPIDRRLRRLELLPLLDDRPRLGQLAPKLRSARVLGRRLRRPPVGRRTAT
jgi:Glycosyl transferase family 2